ncbi:cyclic nucleotide-binding domain-containing protein [Blastococcus sp. MG754426]|uniref:ATP-binding protein n=1 Tax=unclassified Blastococcus TaxID=2619396 RepID=UPI001EF05533|nr:MULTISPECIES: ATP-binding protein [unclassified Blastococcus]MCF6508240.1 cyclic nucleotide-binding domain-containing protein [Blastococcus sp. MG754426]MCF6512133.1 cyclic nucleotide-binding domain-containing protein [Blastococcus sp. MG754427]MCF6734541.1 cyclic nucleotide-binding domain-containing protein [Blastococcus sp. KM273129]
MTAPVGSSAPAADVVAALRRSALFGLLPEREVTELAATTERWELPPGGVLVEEGSPPDALFVVLEGELEVTRETGGGPVLLNLCGPGEVIGELGIAHGRPRSATVRARTPVVVERLGAEALDRLLAHPGSARALLTATSRRLDHEHGLLRHHERMAALGALAAGLLHELNNPAAAVQRGAARLRALLADAGAGNPLAPLAGAVAVPEDPLDRADAEQEVSARLAGAGLADGWADAADLVRLGVDPGALGAALAGLPPEQRGPAVHDLARSGQVAALLDEISTGAEYLSRIVSGVRPLAYAADQSLTDVDVHAGLDQALVLLRHKVPPGVRVVRDLDPAPQHVLGWPADLAMVWTNLLDNALAAVGDRGEVTVRTRGEPDRVVVDIEDTGGPVPPEVLARAFDAFYTTKPIGQGTGLGLATSLAVVQQRHGGELGLTSEGGITRARVVLPRRR